MVIGAVGADGATPTTRGGKAAARGATAMASGWHGQSVAGPYQVRVNVEVNLEGATGETLAQGRSQMPIPPPDGRNEPLRAGRGAQSDPEHDEIDLWMLPRFQVPVVKSSDQWDLTYMDRGWAIRVHGKARKRLYHPVHGTVPFDVALLSSERMTSRFLVNGGHHRLLHDDWRDSTRTSDDASWRGYTFFRLVRSATETPGNWDEAASSLGSYDLVDS